MYASIQRFDHGEGTTLAETVIPAGKRLAVALQRLPGFVAYVLLEVGAGQLLSMGLFEDADGLQAAEQLLARDTWIPGRPVSPAADQAWATHGEVLVQAGL
jgi:hypothetical protein